jgi:hypothetical protein
LKPSFFRFSEQDKRKDPGVYPGSQRFSPAFCLTYVPGFSTIPFAEAALFLIDKSSVAIMLNRIKEIAEVRCKEWSGRLIVRSLRLPLPTSVHRQPVSSCRR